ncbi:MAG: phage major capsid protein [Acidimicrobiales bacterium]
MAPVRMGRRDRCRSAAAGNLRDDVRYLLNHDGLPLARTVTRTLDLESDDHGLVSDATVDLRQTLASDLTIAIERGDLDQMSFAPAPPARNGTTTTPTGASSSSSSSSTPRPSPTRPTRPPSSRSAARPTSTTSPAGSSSNATPPPSRSTCEGGTLHHPRPPPVGNREHIPTNQSEGTTPMFEVIPTSSQALPREADLYRRGAGRMRMADVIARGGVSGGDGPTMLDMVRRQISAALDEREALRTQAATVESAIAERDGGAPTAEELEQVRGFRTQIAAIDARINGDGTDDNPGLRAREAELVAHADADRRARDEAQRLAELGGAGPDPVGDTGRRGLDDGPGAGLPYDHAARGGELHSIYRSNPGLSFFRDALWANTGDSAAQERMARSLRFEIDVARRAGQPIMNRGDELRAATTSSFANLVIPAYLVDEAALYARAGAPLLQALRHVPLPPSGMTVNLGRVTTPTLAGVQASENTAPTSQDMVVTAYNPPVVTITGKHTLSRQSVDRGEIVDEIVVQDLFGSYYQVLDTQLISGSGASGQHLGLLNVSGVDAVTYTDAPPTAAELYPKLADAAQQIATNRKLPMDLWVLHSRRWGFLSAAVDSQGRPLIVPVPLAQNPQGTGGVASRPHRLHPPGRGSAAGPQRSGQPRRVDERGPHRSAHGRCSGVRRERRRARMFNFDQLAAESVTMAVLGYSAFGSGRYPSSISVIAGTGLATLTF